MSQISTSIEQSKRLLDAGLDPGSADMCYANVELNSNYCPDIRLSVIPYAQCVETYKTVGLIAEGIVPAWSLSRLWDAFSLDIHGGWFSIGSSTSEDVIEELVRMMEQRHINYGTLSKELLK
jgi:hypothetical protein